MIHEPFPSLTETAFGSHPCRVVSVTYRKLRPFHGGNTGSNPVGDTTCLSSTGFLIDGAEGALGKREGETYATDVCCWT